MLTPESIASKTFRKTLFGYDLEQVDGYLDEIIMEVQRMEEERAEMAGLIDTLSNRLREAEARAAGNARKEAAGKEAPENAEQKPLPKEDRK